MRISLWKPQGISLFEKISPFRPTWRNTYCIFKLHIWQLLGWTERCVTSNVNVMDDTFILAASSYAELYNKLPSAVRSQQCPCFSQEQGRPRVTFRMHSSWDTPLHKHPPPRHRPTAAQVCSQPRPDTHTHTSHTPLPQPHTLTHHTGMSTVVKMWLDILSRSVFVYGTGG